MRIMIAPLLALGLAGCNQMATAPLANPIVPEPVSGTAGPGCEAQISRFKEILAYDLSVGRVHKSVHDKTVGPLGLAEGACRSGRSGEAMGILARTKRASGYG